MAKIRKSKNQLILRFLPKHCLASSPPLKILDYCLLLESLKCYLIPVFRDSTHEITAIVAIFSTLLMKGISFVKLFFYFSTSIIPDTDSAKALQNYRYLSFRPKEKS